MPMAFAGGVIVRGRGAAGTGIGTPLAGLGMEHTMEPALMLGGMAENRAEDEQGEGQEETAGLPGHARNVAGR